MKSSIRGVIFDLDGTLVDSRLDFDLIRREMKLPERAPILETMASLDDDHARWCWEILDRHEAEAAERATAMPGAPELLAQLDRSGIRRAVLTRNTRAIALAMLERLAMPFDLVVAREDAPIKPDPAAILHICEQWNVGPAEVAIVGDFHFDIEAGRRAGAWTALYAAGRDVSTLTWAAEADFVFERFDEVWRWLRAGA